MTESQSGLPRRATPVTVAYLLVTAALAAIFHQSIVQWPAIVIVHLTVCADRDVVAGTGVDPVTPRFSGACSAN